MNVDLDYEVVTDLFKAVLVEDYRTNLKEIRKLQHKEILPDYVKEDLIYSLRLANAMETLMKYYFTSEEAKRIINEGICDE
jgi:hypothetical protein